MSQHGKNFTAGPTDRTEIILNIVMLKQAKFGIGRLPPGLARYPVVTESQTTASPTNIKNSFFLSSSTPDEVQ